MVSIEILKENNASLLSIIKNNELNPLHPNISMHILHTVPYTFPKVLKENLFTDQKLLLLGIIYFILMTSIYGSEVIL